MTFCENLPVTHPPTFWPRVCNFSMWNPLDSWANAVQGRILHAHDLHAADAVYHRICSTNFRTMKQLPAIHLHEIDRAVKRVKVGRPLEKKRAEAFLDVCKYFEENDNEQITVDDLIQLMEEFLTDTEHSAYSYG